MTRSASTGASRGQLLAHPHAGAVQLDAAELRVGPGEVDELEDAEGARAVGRDGLVRLVPVFVHDHHLARGELPLDLGAEEVERAGLGGEEPVVLEPAEDERPDPQRVAEAHELSLGEKDRRRTRPGSFPSRLRPPPRAGARRARSAPRSPRCPRSSEGARPRRGARRGARSCSSGCRCGRARRFSRGPAGLSAARSPSAWSRWWNSARGRLPPGRSGRAASAR